MPMTLPGWDSIEAAARWHRVFEIAGFIALGLLLLFEVIAYIYGNRKDILVAAAEQATAMERSGQEQKANEQRNTEITKANQKAAEAQAVAQQAADQLAKANQKVSELTQNAIPRSLTPDQRSRLFKFLSANPKQKIEADVPTGDNEAKVYAGELVDVISSAGWEVSGPNQSFYDFDPVGVNVAVTDEAHIPVGALVLLSALKDAGIPVIAVTNAKIPLGKIELRIGHKH